MAIKQEQHIIKGMQRDLSLSKFNPEYAFDARNIRITARDNSTLLSVTNERGTKEVTIKPASGEPTPIEGNIIGYNVLNNFITLFTTGDKDFIYRLEYKGDYFEIKVLFKGDLNFDTNYPIQTLGIYETNNIQKVYWIDGLNQPRVININNTYTENVFDFVLPRTDIRSVSILKEETSIGKFPSGIVQYCFSYYKKFGQETSIVYTSDLNYLSTDFGNSPEDTVGCSFKIKLTGLDTTFDFVRIYSIVRSSIDATPTVKIVADLPIKDTVVFIDSNSSGEIVDPSILLYLGGTEFVPNAMTQKDNTIFFGNFSLNNLSISEEDAASIKTNSALSFEKRNFIIESLGSRLYPYASQLAKSSSEIKTFKRGETYRIAVQFQTPTGSLSDPIYLGDIINTICPTCSTIEQYSDYSVAQVKAILTGLSKYKSTYSKARLLMAVPSSSDRSIIAQGVVCPTVYNLQDRVNGTPFSQSSWFFRNESKSDKNTDIEWRHNCCIHNEIQVDNEDNDEIIFKSSENISTSTSLITYTLYYLYSSLPYQSQSIYTGVLRNKSTGELIFSNETLSYKTIKNQLLSYLLEADIPTQEEWMEATSEKSKDIEVGGSSEESLTQSLQEYNYKYYVDKSILTLHSPDAEELNDTSLNNVKFRIVGYAEFQTVLTDYNVQATLGRSESSQVVKYSFSGNIERDGYNTGKPIYWDSIKDNANKFSRYFVYPWHRSGSLNSDGVPEEGKTRTAELKNKVISNLRFYSSTTWFNTFWEAYKEGDNNLTGITDVQLFNSNEISLVRISNPENSLYQNDINYYGNIDKVITAGSKGYPIYYTGTESFSIDNYTKQQEGDIVGTEPVSMKYKSSPHLIFALNYTSDNKQNLLPALNFDYQAFTDGIYIWDDVPYLFELSYLVLTKDGLPTEGLKDKTLGYVSGGEDSDLYSWDESSSQWQPAIGVPHGATCIYFVDENRIQNVYDVTLEGAYPNNYRKLSLRQTINQSILDSNNRYNPLSGFLYIGELYRDIDPESIYGGTNYQSNSWIPIGNFVDLNDSITLYGSEGDTYYQRYDCLKTYAYTTEDTNSLVEIGSFMVETHKNLDGRYDKNRGQENNLAVNNTNFNLFNNVYSQSNNYFNYRILDSKFSNNYFPNQIVWSQEKLASSDTDVWTNINMASTLDLDGDKGEVTSLNSFNNEIYCFQRKGMSNILFNNRVQIPTSDGVPIEITNGLKVSGKRYISNNIGCNNKWSIAESPSGLYFIDNETNSLYLFNGKIQSLSDKLGFRQWIGENNSHEKWDPVNYNNFRTFYDKNNDDVYFVNKDECLCYSELLGQFTSFMSYEKIPAMFNVGSEFYSFNKNKLWQNFEGDYNMFYGEFKPYSITVVANSNEPYDKIFNTLEFRSDTWNDNTLLNSTFDSLEVWNEYQHGTISLYNIYGRPSPLKRKFRVWRISIPRDSINNRNRIRNTWAYIKLTMNTPNTYRTEFHDMIVHYFI